MSVYNLYILSPVKKSTWAKKKFVQKVQKNLFNLVHQVSPIQVNVTNSSGPRNMQNKNLWSNRNLCLRAHPNFLKTTIFTDFLICQIAIAVQVDHETRICFSWNQTQGIIPNYKKSEKNRKKRFEKKVTFS